METSPYNTFRKKEIEKRKKLIKIGGVLLLVVCIVVIILLLTKGKRTVTGEHPKPEKTSSLICEKKGLQYPKINDTDSENKDISIVAIFNGETDLRSIALTYTLVYGSQTEAEHAEALARFDFVGHLGGLGMKYGEFDNNITRFDNKLVISVYGKAEDLESEDRAAYFMLEDEFKKGEDIKSLAGVRDAFEGKGFSCEASTDNK